MLDQDAQFSSPIQWNFGLHVELQTLVWHFMDDYEAPSLWWFWNYFTENVDLCYCNVASRDFWRSFLFKLFFAPLQKHVQGERSAVPTPNNRSESWRESSYSTFTSTRTDACSCLTFCVSQIGALLLLSISFNVTMLNTALHCRLTWIWIWAQFFWTSVVVYIINFQWHERNSWLSEMSSRRISVTGRPLSANKLCFYATLVLEATQSYLAGTGPCCMHNLSGQKITRKNHVKTGKKPVPPVVAFLVRLSWLVKFTKQFVWTGFYVQCWAFP